MNSTVSSRLLLAFEKLTLLRLSVALVVMTALLLLTMGFTRVREAGNEYQLAVDQIDQIQAMTSGDDIYALTQEDLAWLENEFATLQDRIDHIEGLSELPLGLDGALSSAPWISPRYQAAMETLEVGRLLAEAGQVIAQIGEEALTALDDTGIRYEEGVDRDTWLDVLERREEELNAALLKMDEATGNRAEIQDHYLPSGILYRLQQIDSVIERFSSQRELADDLPLAFDALGADGMVRYLVLFQNPAETRPTGGFVGTVAFVEIERGQIRGYDFHDVYDVSQDYNRNRSEGTEPPWALATYVRPDHVQYQDANWWPHFPRTAQQYIQMTDEAGWGEVAAVVAVQPDTITDLIAITGPITVEVDGEPREITTENLFEEAERQRRIVRQGGEAEADHKEVISLIGEVLLDHLAEGDRDEMIDAAFLMFDALDRRDMQAYHESEAVQEFLEARNWAGLLEPEPGTPTISSIFANVTGLKTSLFMQPEMQLDILEADTIGVTEAILNLSLTHFGDENEDPFYEGFQLWWLDVILPDGAAVIDTIPTVADDPDASNGGSFVINLDVGDQVDIAIRFTMPDSERMIIRRQPGLLNMPVTLSHHACDDPLTFELDEDAVILLDGECPVREEPDVDAYTYVPEEGVN